ncbi:MAG: hypothetical protein AB7I04_22300 [Pseudomonadales bacterium]
MWLLAAAALAWVPASAQEALGDIESERYGELEKGKSAFKETWVLPGADLSKYRNLYLWEAIFEYRDVGDPDRYRSTLSRSSRTTFGIAEEARTEFEKVVGESFLKEIEKGRQYQIVEKIEPNTLILRGGLLDIVSFVPPETVGRSDVYLSNIGEATLVIELLDGDTGTVLAMVSERRKIQPPGGGQIDRFTMPSTSVTISSDVRRWAQSAAAKLRRELEAGMK